MTDEEFVEMQMAVELYRKLMKIQNENYEKILKLKENN